MEHHPPTLAISGLRAGFPGPQGLVPAVDGVDLTVPRGTIVGLVGESGCGKSVTALSVLGLLPPNGQVAGGTIDFGGQDLLTLPPDALRRLRGDRIAMIFQDPMTSLNPVYPVGRQVAEVLRLHRGLDRKAAKARTVDLFHQVDVYKRQDHPGGVVGAVDDDPLHLGGEGGLQGGKVDLKVLQVGGYGGEGAPGALYKYLIFREVGGEGEEHVPRAAQGRENAAQSPRRPGGEVEAVGVIGCAVAAV